MERLSTQKNRIIDVNFNRLREALKIGEDILRFYLGNKKLLLIFRKEVKKIRKVIIEKEKEYLPDRDIKRDIGKQYEYDKPEIGKKGLLEVLFRNLKRAQESCRLLEEIFKIKKEERLARFFKEERFFLYEFEKKVNDILKKEFDLRVYPIIDIETLKYDKIQEYGKLALKLVRGGATIIQLRAGKNFPTREFIKIGQEIKKRLKNRKVKFLINDRVDVCLALSADGVHLGKDDMPIKLAREILGEDKIIGATVRSVSELKKAEKEGADYCCVGSIFPSETKKSAKVCGLETLEKIVKESKIPVCAIGGINSTNVEKVLKYKVSGIAFISAIKEIKEMAEIIKCYLKDSS